MTRNFKIVLGILMAAVVVLAAWYFRMLLAYILTAIIISFIGAPIVKFLKRLKIKELACPSWLAALITLVTFITVVVLFFLLFAPLVATEAEAISKIDINQVSQSLEGHLMNTENFLSQFNLSGDDRSNREFLLAELQQLVDFGQISGVVNNLFALLGNALVALFSILFMAFFFLKDGRLFQKMIFSLTPDEHMERIKNIMNDSHDLLTRYFVGVVAQIGIVTILISIGLSILGVENAVLIGFLAGILNLIPYIGPIIGMVLGLFIAITTNLYLDFHDALLPLSLKVLVVFIGVQLLDNFFTQPVILGNRVKAHPLEIFIVISIAATLAGITGMILAIPVYTILRVVAREFLSKFKVVRSLTRDIQEEKPH
jgi:predicted PurR-regulated permease PerM